jgi:tRNA-specific 2-thiouridylase
VIVGEERHLSATGLEAAEVNWLIEPDTAVFDCSCKIRYRHQPVGCRVETGEGKGCTVHFREPQKSVTPGQSVVFYRGDEVLGGARIVSALPAPPD